jgi:hypothetical protein
MTYLMMNDRIITKGKCGMRNEVTMSHHSIYCHTMAYRQNNGRRREDLCHAAA